MVKTTGIEFKRFYNDPLIWTQDAYHDDDFFIVDGKEIDECEDIITAIKDASKVEIHSGVIIYPDGSDIDMILAFKKWKKAQTITVLIVELEKTSVDNFIAMVKEFGAKVIKS